MLVRSWLRFCFHALSAIPSEKFLEIVTVRAKSPERILVEQALDAAARADLIGATLGANRPAHLAMPASSQDDRSTSQTGRHQADRPQPTRTLALQRLGFFFQLPPYLQNLTFQNMTIPQ
jgi:hypothetical protein